MAKMITLETVKDLTTPKDIEVKKTPEVISTETDEEIVERLRNRFAILDDMTRAV